MRYLSLFLGLILILLALLANLLGIDHNSRWGASRYLLLFAGILLAGIPLCIRVYQSRLVPDSIRRRLSERIRAAAAILKRTYGSPRTALGLSAAAFLFVSIFSTWYASLGLFPAFPKLDNLYIPQGEAFLRGQLSLLEPPDARLAALENPYDLQARENIPYLWDASYYQGKYYIYWGPVPAVIFAALERITGTRPPDAAVALLSAVGLAAVMVLLLWHIRKQVYPHAPTFSVGLFLLAAGINLPWLFLLGRARVYETSILAGQFFLFLGLLAWFFACKSGRLAWLVLAGLGWALAIATRTNLAVSVAIYLPIAFADLWRSSQGHRQAWTKMGILLIPLVVCGLGLGIYNFARFGNPLETGLNYQLTVSVDHKRIFSPVYSLPNLYLYLFYPTAKVGLFPVIRSLAVPKAPLPVWAALPQGKLYDEAFFGMASTLPVLWLLGLITPLACWGWSTRGRWSNREDNAPPSLSNGWRRFVLMVGLGGLAQFLVLLFYYYNAMRFIADFYLPALLMAAFLTWEIDARIRRKPWLRGLLWLVAGTLVAWTMVTAFFGGFDNPPQVFRTYNPALQTAFGSGWNHLYASPGLLGTLLRLAVRLL